MTRSEKGMAFIAVLISVIAALCIAVTIYLIYIISTRRKQPAILPAPRTANYIKQQDCHLTQEDVSTLVDCVTNKDGRDTVAISHEPHSVPLQATVLHASSSTIENSGSISGQKTLGENAPPLGEIQSLVVVHAAQVPNPASVDQNNVEASDGSLQLVANPLLALVNSHNGFNMTIMPSLLLPLEPSSSPENAKIVPHPKSINPSMHINTNSYSEALASQASNGAALSAESEGFNDKILTTTTPRDSSLKHGIEQENERNETDLLMLSSQRPNIGQTSESTYSSCISDTTGPCSETNNDDGAHNTSHTQNNGHNEAIAGSPNLPISDARERQTLSQVSNAKNAIEFMGGIFVDLHPSQCHSSVFPVEHDGTRDECHAASIEPGFTLSPTNQTNTDTMRGDMGKSSYRNSMYDHSRLTDLMRSDFHPLHEPPATDNDNQACIVKPDQQSVSCNQQTQERNRQPPNLPSQESEGPSSTIIEDPLEPMHQNNNAQNGSIQEETSEATISEEDRPICGETANHSAPLNNVALKCSKEAKQIACKSLHEVATSFSRLIARKESKQQKRVPFRTPETIEWSELDTKALEGLNSQVMALFDTQINLVFFVMPKAVDTSPNDLIMLCQTIEAIAAESKRAQKTFRELLTPEKPGQQRSAVIQWENKCLLSNIITQIRTLMRSVIATTTQVSHNFSTEIDEDDFSHIKQSLAVFQNLETLIAISDVLFEMQSQHSPVPNYALFSHYKELALSQLEIMECIKKLSSIEALGITHHITQIAGLPYSDPQLVCEALARFIATKEAATLTAIVSKLDRKVLDRTLNAEDQYKHGFVH